MPDGPRRPRGLPGHSAPQAHHGTGSSGTAAGPPCQAFCSLLGALPDTLTSVLWAQVVSALSSPKIGPRNLGAWHEVFCHSGPWGTQKMALPDEPDAGFDPNTILQTQDRLSQDYEGLRAQAEVTLLVHGTFTPLVWILSCEPRDRAVTGHVPCPRRAWVRAEKV